jgi:hypothetical protein
MKRDEMNAKVREDLKHISKYEPDKAMQGIFRMVYTMDRRHHLGRNPEARPAEAIQAALDSFQELHPGYQPDYDPGYFAGT